MGDSAENVVVVMGIPVEGLENQRLVKRVMIVSVIFALVICCNSLLQMIKEAGNALSRFMGLCLGLLVPVCGYLGAKRGDRNLLGCFWGCNLFSGVCNVIACITWIIMVTLFAEKIKEAQRRCQDDPNYVETGAVAQLSGGGQCPQIQRVHSTVNNDTWIIALTIVFAFINIIMNTLACWWGKRLYDKNVFTTARHSHPPIDMRTISVQPVTATFVGAAPPLPPRGEGDAETGTSVAAQAQVIGVAPPMQAQPIMAKPYTRGAP